MSEQVQCGSCERWLPKSSVVFGGFVYCPDCSEPTKCCEHGTPRGQGCWRCENAELNRVRAKLDAAEREAAAARAIIRTAGDMLQISVDIPQDLVTHVRLVTEEAAAARGELELGAPLHQAHCRIAELEAERDSLRAERDRMREALREAKHCIEMRRAYRLWATSGRAASTGEQPPIGWMKLVALTDSALGMISEALRDGE